MFFEVFCEVFCHPFGQRGDQHTFVNRRTGADLRQQIVNLRRHRTHLNDRIQQAGRSYHLIDHFITGFLQLIVARRRRNVDSLRSQRLELFKFKRTVIQRRRQTESVFDQGFFTRPIAAIHASNLRDSHVGFIHHQQAIGRQVIKQRRRRLARAATGQIAGVVFNPRAVTQLIHHFQIELGTLT